MDENPWTQMESMVRRTAPKPEPVKRPPADPVEMKRRRRRGKTGEYEVVQLFKKNGWPEAFRAPGSGSWRPYGAQDSSPFPLDIASGWPTGWPLDRKGPMAGPWMAEVKFDERMLKPGRHGMMGESFVRATLIKVQEQWQQYVRSPGARAVEPVAFCRAGNQAWRVFWLARPDDEELVPQLESWSEITVDRYFTHAPSLAEEVG